MTAVEIVSRVIDALNQSAIPHMLVGSFSSNLYRVPRSTKDADFVQNVLAIQLPNLDMPYIRSCCVQHNTLGLLDRLLQSSV